MYNYEKIIKNLTNLNNKLDFTFINKNTIEKINKNNDIYTYDNIKTNIEILSKLHEIKNRYYMKSNFKLTNNIHEKIIFIADGYARGVSKYVNKFNPQKHKLSNAYVKLWEIYSTFDWLVNKSNITCFHMAEAPGQWINTTRTFMERKFKNYNYDWFANSLNPDHPRIKGIINALRDDYGFIANNKDKWLYGSDGSGDITMSSNIKWFGEYIHNKMPHVDIVTGDAGVNIEMADLRFLQLLDISQAILVGHTSTIGSCCVIKQFLPYLPSKSNSIDAGGFFMSMMYLYHIMFEEFHMFKPLSSSPGSGEIYVVCRNFKGLNDMVKNDLLNYIDHFKENLPLFRKEDIPSTFSNKVCEFINKLMERNIDNDMLTLEIMKCIIKQKSAINCNFYLGKPYTDIKYKAVREFIKKFNMMDL